MIDTKACADMWHGAGDGLQCHTRYHARLSSCCDGRLVMGTRSGDLDPAVVPFLAERLSMDVADVEEVLNRKSGLLGLAGVADLRAVTVAAGDGDESAQLALKVQAVAALWKEDQRSGNALCQLRERCLRLELPTPDVLRLFCMLLSSVLRPNLLAPSCRSWAM